MKLYADEQDHAAVRELSGLAISCLARVEVPAAMWRKYRMGELRAPQARALAVQFEGDYFGDGSDGPRFTVMALPDWILESAARLLPHHGLRAFDAIQLASAKAARTADPAFDTIACFDEDLRNAASAEGFDLIPGKP